MTETGCIAVLNAGSSSIKFALYDSGVDGALLYRGQIERIGVGPHLVVRDATGKIVAEKRWPDSALDHHAATTEILAHGQTLLAGRPVLAFGHRVVVTTANPTLDADGTIDGVICVRYDITEAQHAVANQERLTDVLLAARRLQHFLGNQLALTLGYVELLTLDPRLPAELRDRVDEALRGVIEATETLSRLRLVTRLEIDHDDPSLEEHLGHTGPP